ncbi:MAG: sulfite exporter TauE/SafE family protein, partial [Gemmatimonadetes bacterium]|nr:sulfite exporter TauE/SafE family protein [Gemmatimonadota bacterium]
NWLCGAVLSFFVVFFSSVLGIGGGIIHVPVMIHFLGFPAHIATATSHFILAISAGVGAGTHIALGHLLAGPAILMGIGVVGGAQVGARLAQRMRGTRIIRLLSLALIVVALRLLLS